MVRRSNTAISDTKFPGFRNRRLLVLSPVLVSIALVLLLLGSARSSGADWQPLIERLVADGSDRKALEALFDRPEVRFEPDAMARKVQALIRSRIEGPDSVQKRKDTVNRGYLRDRTIDRAHAYALENKAILDKAYHLYGVPQEIVVSILLIETHLGRSTGHHRVFNRLASMARSTDIDTVRPHIDGSLLTEDHDEFARRRCREKADWAYKELRALLRIAETDRLDPLEIRGSFYGAIGQCQFMPSNVFAYGVDADRDGRVNLFDKTDALHSIANYLRGYGWRPGLDRDGEHKVIFGYNHNTVYANTVLAIADKLKARKRSRP